MNSLKESQPCLEVKEDGQIWLNDGQQSILVSDQEKAHKIIKDHFGLACHQGLNEIKPGIYPIPDLKWVVGYRCLKCGGLDCISCDSDVDLDAKVAVIKSESLLIGERSAEPIMDGHGYEIFELHTIRSKKKKIEILKGHIRWTENKHTEVLSDLKDMLNELL